MRFLGRTGQREKQAPINDENNHVPNIFESVCKQYLIRLNRRGLLEEPFEKTGRYYYDDPVRTEIAQVEEAGFECYKYGFMSWSGFAVKPKEKLILISLDEMYDEFSFKAQGFDVK